MPKEFDERVKAIKRSGGADNPYAVARAQLGSDAEIRARRKRKKRKAKSNHIEHRKRDRSDK